MTTVYKLTDQNGQTYRQTQWGPGVTHTAPGAGNLCTSGWIHAYTDPVLALLLNPIHSNFDPPRLWEAEGEVGTTDRGLQVGCTTLTTVRELRVPTITTEQRVTFGILAARCVCKDRRWCQWAARWLDGTDRSPAAARAAVTALPIAVTHADYAARVAANAVASTTTYAFVPAYSAGAAADHAVNAGRLSLAQLAYEATGIDRLVGIDY
jgi:hypothetical protein